MRSLVDQGKSIIFITHKLREVLEFADRITVIRRGKVVGETIPAEADSGQLAEMMVGRAVHLIVDRKPATVGEPVLSIDSLLVLDDQAGTAVKNLSLQVKSGEIVGIAGIQGNGQTELVEAVTGLRDVESGSISLLGQAVTNQKPRFITELGSAHVPEDRQRDGLVLSFPIVDNMALQSYYQPPFSQGPTLQSDYMRLNAAKLVTAYDVRTPGIDTAAGSLSGGNQQKVIVAREFSRDITLLVASQPTRGLDVGSIEYIHDQLIQKRDSGVAVLLVSTELDEIMNLSDRIAVMYEGELVAIVEADSVTKEQVGLLMAGGEIEAVLAEKVSD